MGKIEDLESIKRLKDSGSLTEEEFKIEKQKILNENGEKENIKTDKSNPKKIIIIFIIILACIFIAIPIIINISLSSNGTIHRSSSTSISTSF